MKKVSDKVWKQKAEGLKEWRKNRTSLPNFDIYRRIVSMVHVGDSVLDVGCGQCYLKECLSPATQYIGIDPFPIVKEAVKCSAEQLVKRTKRRLHATVFMLAALDNVRDVRKSLEGLKAAALENIVILTGIGIEPDENHTHRIDREDLVSVLGEPFQEVEISPKLFLFEWRL